MVDLSKYVESCSSTTKNIYLHDHKVYEPQIVRVEIDHVWLPPIKSRFLWSRGLAKSCFKLKTYLHYRNAHRHQTWEGSDLPWKTPTHRVTWPFHHVVLQDHATYYKHNFITTIPVATKLGRVVTYSKKFPFIKLRDPSVTWSCNVTWRIEYVKSPLTLDQWPPNMARWWLTLRYFHPYSQITLCGHLKSCVKLKTLNPQCLWSPALSGWWQRARSYYP